MTHKGRVSRPAGILFVRKDPKNPTQLQFLLGREKRFKITPAIDGNQDLCFPKIVYTCAFGKYEANIDRCIVDTAIRETKEEHPGLLTSQLETIVRNYKLDNKHVIYYNTHWNIDKHSHSGHMFVIKVNSYLPIGTPTTKKCALPKMKWYSENSLPEPINCPCYACIRYIHKDKMSFLRFN